MMFWPVDGKSWKLCQDPASYGQFHKGDSYIVLKTVESDSGCLVATVSVGPGKLTVFVF